MTTEAFLLALQDHATSFAGAISTGNGDWTVKGFIDVFEKIYTISTDTKIISKIFELLLFPMFVDFGASHGLNLELCPQQNFYPDITFRDQSDGRKFAVDVKSTYRISPTDVNGMTLGAFTGYFRNRDSRKNVLYPYEQYAGHFVLGVIYDKADYISDERQMFSLRDLHAIPSVVRNFAFFAQPKFKIASSSPGSGNTKNIGSTTRILQLLEGSGPFASLGEEVYDDYWMYYQTSDMARKLEMKRPYKNIQEYLEYKSAVLRGVSERDKEIAKRSEKATLEGSVGT